MTHPNSINGNHLTSIFDAPETMEIFQNTKLNEEKGRINSDPASLIQNLIFHFPNFFLNPIRPNNPEPRRSNVAGSGTGVIAPPQNCHSTSQDEV